MKKYTIFLFFLFLFLFCNAQRSEVGTLMGISFYMGDLNNIPFKDSKFGGGLLYRYNFTPRVALKTNILFGKIQGSDSNNHSINKNEKGEYLWDYSERGLSFSSPITEISTQLEINFFNIYTQSNKNQITPYLFGGAALFSFNPQSEYNGVTYDLQPIGTEGQGWAFDNDGNLKKKYSITGFAVPFGVGFKANLGRYICIGAEWGLRYTFTKYLDDVGGLYYDFSDEQMPATTKEIVSYFADPTHSHSPSSQRYSTTKNDWYSFGGIIITIRIGNEDRYCEVKTNVKLKHHQGKKR